MPKNWWFKFDFKAWRDADLRRCSAESRGVWLEMLCVMYEKEDFQISGTYQELAQLSACSESVIARAVTELKQKNVADVTLGNGTVTLVSRRLKRELTSKEHTRLRVQRHRGNANVTVQSKSNKKEVRTNTEEKASAFAFPTNLLDSLKNYLGVVQLPNESDWLGLADFAEVNLYTIDQVLECYKFLESQSWRDGPISPKAMQNNLPKFVKETSNPKAKFDIDFSVLQAQ